MFRNATGIRGKLNNEMMEWKHEINQAFQLESLILAQSERYWRALDMQVERFLRKPWRTGE